LGVGLKFLVHADDHALSPEALPPVAKMEGVAARFADNVVFCDCFLEADPGPRVAPHNPVRRIRARHRVAERTYDPAIRDVPGDSVACLRYSEIVRVYFAHRKIGWAIAEKRQIPVEAFVVVLSEKIGFFDFRKSYAARKHLMQPRCARALRSDRDEIG
jgi:hypothetical protein